MIWRLRCRTTSQPGNRENRADGSPDGEIASVGFEAGRRSERSTNSQFTILASSFFGMQGSPFPIRTLSPDEADGEGSSDCSSQVSVLSQAGEVDRRPDAPLATEESVEGGTEEMGDVTAGVTETGEWEDSGSTGRAGTNGGNTPRAEVAEDRITGAEL